MALAIEFRYLYPLITERVRAHFGAPASHVWEYADWGEVEREARSSTESGIPLAGYFNKMSARIALREDDADLIEKFMRGEFRSGDPSRHSWELRQLRKVRNAFDTLIHENIHALGAADSGVFSDDFWAGGRLSHISVLAEGVAELATLRHGNAILASAGVAQVDPRILEVRGIHAGKYYPERTAAARDFLTFAARLSGTTLDQEICSLIRDGSSRAALDNCIGRIFAARIRQGTPWAGVTRAHLRVTNAIADGLWAAIHPRVVSKGQRSQIPHAHREMARLQRLIHHELLSLDAVGLRRWPGPRSAPAANEQLSA